MTDLPHQSTAISSTPLRCTVNGGLEDFAKREVENVLQEFYGKEVDACEVSIDRGNTGSRMFIEGAPMEELTLLSHLLQRLRYVDYVSLHLGSSECHKTTEDGMSEATKKIMGKISDNQTIVNIFKTCHDLLKDKQVGLEPLSGKILPHVMNVEMEGMGADATTTPAQPFAPNTIHTQPEVAELVVETTTKVLEQGSIGDTMLGRALWLDAGCGNGSLLHEMPATRRIGMDLNPIQDDNNAYYMHTADFLKDVTTQWLREKHADYAYDTPLIVVSNPPFAQDSRGNYRPIVQFIEHSLQNLKASLAAFIVPTKFARQRVMESYGMDLNNTTTIVARMNLPNNAFYDPSSNKAKHVPSTLLIMKRAENKKSSENDDADATTAVTSSSSNFRIRVEGSRNKSHFRNVSTQSMETTVRLAMMEHFGIDLDVLSQQDRDSISIMTISAELTKQGKGKAKQAVLDLWLQLNPKRPLSLVNSMCATPSIQPPHSLGWITTSCKPNVAAAMVNSVGILDGAEEKAPSVVVNAMCGGGTPELEASSATNPCLWLSGDSCRQALLEAKQRISSLQTDGKYNLFCDFVQWDCQSLPLRDGIVDAFLADLPIAGGKFKSEKTKAHYKPTSDGDSSTTNLDYRTVIRQSLRVLTPATGRAAFVSVDANSLKHGMLSYQSYWIPILEQNKLTLGGLPGIFFCIKRRAATTKNVSMWLDDRGQNGDYSDRLLVVAQEACGRYKFDHDSWELAAGDDGNPRPFNFITKVDLVDVFQSEPDEETRISHCYRMKFNPIISNQQSKDLERGIRDALKKNPIAAGQELR